MSSSHPLNPSPCPPFPQPSFFQKLSQTILGPVISSVPSSTPMSSSLLPSPPASPQNRRNKRRKTRITTPSSIICVNCRAVNAYDSSMTSLFCDSCGAILVRGGRLMSGSTDDNDPTTASLKEEKPHASSSTSLLSASQTPLASNRSSSGGLTITVPGSSSSKKSQDALHSPTTSLFLGPSQPSTPSVPDDLLPNGRNTGQANSLISSSFKEEAFIAHVSARRLKGGGSYFCGRRYSLCLRPPSTKTNSPLTPIAFASLMFRSCPSALSPCCASSALSSKS